MPESAEDFPVADDFCKFLESSKEEAVGLHLPSTSQSRIFFYPEDKLRDYLTGPRIRKLLDYYDIPATEYRSIQESHLIVFAILIRIGRVAHILQFLRRDRLADDRLPILNEDELPHDCKTFFEVFFQIQWHFCAQSFRRDRLNDTYLEDKRIIPITYSEPLNAGPDSDIYKVHIYDGYDKLLNQNDDSRTKVFVVKTCPAHKAHIHRDEVNVYKAMSAEDKVLDNMVRFYGSWRQGDTYNILLEYVDGGTLEDFFKKTDPPTNLQEMVTLWKKFCDLTSLIALIHQHPHPSDKHRILQGIHNDIKGKNILVTKRNGPSRFDVTFKLADFGLADFEYSGRDPHKHARRDMHGTQMFSAPECYNDEADLLPHIGIRAAYPSKDIWSFGCVLSEVAVWAGLGNSGLADYRNRRKLATDPTGHSGCFHDKKRVLDAVLDMHHLVRESRRQCDTLINGVLNIVESMLDDVPLRPSAEQVYNRFRNTIKVVLRHAPELRITLTSPDSPAFHVRNDTTSPRLQPPEMPPGSAQLALGITFDSSSDQTTSNPYLSSPSVGASPNSTTLPGSGWGKNSPYALSPTSRYHTRGGHVHEREERLLHSRNSTGSSPTTLPPHPMGDIPLESHRTSPLPEGTPPMINRTVIPPLANELSKPATELSNNQIGKLPIRTSLRLNSPETQKRTSFTRQALPEVSIDQVLIWRLRTKRDPSTPSFPGHERLRNLDGRDQIFLFDDSESMLIHWVQVMRTFEALAYLVKRKDPDGIEIRFTSKPSYKRVSKDRKPLLTQLKSASPSGEWDICSTLGQILDDYDWDFPQDHGGLTSRLRNKTRKKTKKWGVTIYVFTDGVWKPGQDWLTDLVDMIKALLDKKAQPRQIGIQFVQFGTDEEGTQRMKILDDELLELGVPKDIIDIERHDGNVFKMLFGSIDRGWDGHSSSDSHPSADLAPSSASAIETDTRPAN